MARKSVSTVIAAALLCLASATLGVTAPTAAGPSGGSSVLAIPPLCC